MARKHSSRVAQWRQQKVKQDRKDRAVKHFQAAENLLTNTPLGDAESGIVVTQFGKQLLIEDQQGDLHECVSRRTVDKLVCGDCVRWRRSAQGNGVVVSRLTRHSELGRPNYQGQIKVIAANIDLIFIVVAPEPRLDEDLINRYLVAASLTDIPASLIVNKIDLLNDKAFDNLQQQLQIYADLDIDVVYVSCAQNTGIQALSNLFSRQLAIVVGQSGVGKSSMINTLLPQQEICIGKISARSKLGKHTTTAAQLYRLGDGGIVDSPGIREFGLGHIGADAIAHGFIEFRPYIGACKFNDCRHQHEPGCAIKSAVNEQQSITKRRYQSYLRIINSLAKP